MPRHTQRQQLLKHARHNPYGQRIWWRDGSTDAAHRPPQLWTCLMHPPVSTSPVVVSSSVMHATVVEATVVHATVVDATVVMVHATVVHAMVPSVVRMVMVTVATHTTTVHWQAVNPRKSAISVNSFDDQQHGAGRFSFIVLHVVTRRPPPLLSWVGGEQLSALALDAPVRGLRVEPRTK